MAPEGQERPDPPEPEEGAPSAATEEAVEAALAELSEPGRLREAEQRVARSMPQLQRILASALAEGGWFDEAHRSQVLAAATKPDPDERIAAVRALLAEETRLGMLVGVAVGWELSRKLDRGDA